MELNYEDVYEIAYAIGYTKGRNPQDAKTHTEAFSALLARTPTDHLKRVAVNRYEQGFVIGSQT